MATSAPDPNGSPATNLGMAPNVAGLLCYAPCCIGLVFSIVVAIVEKQSRFVRFHGFQSLLLHGALLAAGVGLQIVQMGVGMVLGPLALLISVVGLLVGLASLALMIFLMVKAHAGEELQLPVIGEMAKGWV